MLGTANPRIPYAPETRSVGIFGGSGVESHEDDISTALADLLSRSGFTAAQTRELQLHRIRWPLMDEEQ